MNLVIDIGNTLIKTALFADNKIYLLKTFESFEQLLADFELINKSKNVIISSVVDGLDHFYETLSSKVPCFIFKSSTKIPIVNLYQSINTLGSDRLSASIASYYLYPNNNVLTIDVGTCIKYNFVNSQNQFLGGAISPGIQMRFKSLANFTSKLPLIEADFMFNDLIGTNTQTSILSGVLNGCVAEIDGIIENYKQQYPEILVLLTGGDSEYFAKRLKNSIFAHQNLVLKGLNDILNYNIELK